MNMQRTDPAAQQVVGGNSAWRAPRLAWGLLGAHFAFAALAPLAYAAAAGEPLSTARHFVGNYGLFMALSLPFAVVAALLAARRPENRVGWLMLGIVLTWNVAVFCSGVEDFVTAVGHGPLAGWLVWSGDWLSILPLMSIFTLLLLIFPTGRPPSPRWRPLVWLAGAALLCWMAREAFGVGDPGDAGALAVPDAVTSPTVSRWLDAIAPLGFLLLAIAIFGSVAALITRLRRARGVERQQVKWFAYVSALIAVAFILSGADAVSSNPVTGLVTTLAWAVALPGIMIGLPGAIGIAILRYRLFDIDRLINRTIVYGALTALLAALYVGGVVLLETLLNPLTAGSDLAIAGSTLAVAALFRPARARVQRAVDRRFNRRRYNAERTLDAFAARLRDELDLEALTTELRAVVHETMQPAHVSLWLRSASQGTGGGER